MTDLLPCPFCGEKAYFKCHKSDYGLKTLYKVMCSNLNCAEKWMDSKDNAITYWNTRTLPEDVYTIKIPKEIVQELNEPLDD